MSVSFTNYTDLKASVIDYLVDRKDLTTYIDGFITLAEEQFNKEIRHWRMETRTNLTLTAGNRFVSVPSDFLEMRALVVQSTPLQELRYITPSRIDELYAFSSSQGVPEVYSLVGSEIKVAPTPASAYTVEIVYYQSLSGIVANSTNWLLTNYPSIYLAGTMVQAGLYIKDMNTVQVWGAVYDRSKQSLEDDNKKRDWGHAPLRMLPDQNVNY